MRDRKRGRVTAKERERKGGGERKRDRERKRDGERQTDRKRQRNREKQREEENQSYEVHNILCMANLLYEMGQAFLDIQYKNWSRLL